MTRRKKDRTKESYSRLDISTDSDNGLEVKSRLVKKRRKKRKKDEEPFLLTNIKVGSVIATICVSLYALYTITSVMYSSFSRFNGSGASEDVWSQYVNEEGDGYTGGAGEPIKKSKIIPNFDVSEHKANAFNVAETLMNQINQIESESNGSDTGLMNVIMKNPEKKAIVNVLKALEQVKQEFVIIYGGENENAAREIIERGIITFSKSTASKSDETLSDIRNFARRIFQSRKEKKPFKISFAGSSAVAGYGNFLKQTFPIVLKDLLVEPMELLGIELEVTNAAIAGIASFPYGWCLDNFMGENVDVVSWDGSLLDRADTDAAFESYLRRVVNLESSPMLIIREGVYSESKRQIIQKYVDNGNLVDPIIVNINAAAEPFLDLDDDIIPIGFKDWQKFGAPNGSPGSVQSGRAIRLSIKQHELVAWLMSMHFITAIEIAAAHLLGMDDVGDDWLNSELTKSELILPKPFSEIQNNDQDLMFGEPVDETLGINSTEWVMDEIFCRTTFDPVSSGRLKDIVVSGTTAEDLELSLPRGPMLYNKNWVMALGDDAFQTARANERYKFEYKFIKKAYYGGKSSGILNLFIPFINDDKKRRWRIPLLNRKKTPTDSITSIVVCEVNEHIGAKQCNMVESMSYKIGGVNTTAHFIEANGVSYQGKKNCVRLDVPSASKWTTRKKLEKENIQSSSLRKASDGANDNGLQLEISVNDFRFWKDGFCSISHVIWQQKRKN